MEYSTTFYSVQHSLGGIYPRDIVASNFSFQLSSITLHGGEPPKEFSIKFHSNLASTALVHYILGYSTKFYSDFLTKWNVAPSPIQIYPHSTCGIYTKKSANFHSIMSSIEPPMKFNTKFHQNPFSKTLVNFPRKLVPRPIQIVSVIWKMSLVVYASPTPRFISSRLCI